MHTQYPLWSAWARFLQRWGMHGVTAVLLESLGPLNLLLAQLIYASGSLLGRSSTGGEWLALGEMLESKEKSHLFASFLREENQQ